MPLEICVSAVTRHRRFHSLKIRACSAQLKPLRPPSTYRSPPLTLLSAGVPSSTSFLSVLAFAEKVSCRYCCLPLFLSAGLQGRQSVWSGCPGGISFEGGQRITLLRLSCQQHLRMCGLGFPFVLTPALHLLHRTPCILAQQRGDDKPSPRPGHHHTDAFASFDPGRLH